MGLTVTLAGVDITTHVQEETIQIQDTLGQAAGNGQGGSGRAKTATVLVDLGPVGTAAGAGTVIVTPQLVRMGEIKIYDASSTIIFGGYVTKMVDKVGVIGKTVHLTELDCADYWQFLDRIMVNVVYDGNTDIFMINDLLSTYAPWVDRSLLPTSAAYTFGPKLYRHISLQKALQNICDTTGYMMWVLPTKKVQYVLPTNAATAPFSLVDASSPNFVTAFPHNVTDYEVDDNSAINKVTFYGGKKLSNDYLQNLSNQADGTNVNFLLPYYPHPSSDGHVHVYVNSVEQVLGTQTGSSTNAKNILKSAGGLADVLLNTSGNSFLFNTAPAAGSLVQAKYRYEFPLTVSITSPTSISFYGQTLEGVIIDQSVLDSTSAAQRCRILLLEQAFGLTTLKVTCWKAGLQAGQLLQITNNQRGINGLYVIQEVDTVPLGAGNFEYDISLGAWNWNLVDLLVLITQAAQPQDTSQTEDLSSVVINTITDNTAAHDTMTITKTQTYGLYYARATPVGDGSDAYPGFASISS